MEVHEDATTTRILDAAYDVFARHGAKRATMNQVADASGLGVATVYRRFPRKAHLVRAVAVREAVRMTAEVAAEMERDGTAAEQGAAGFTAFAHAIAKRPFIVRLLRGDDERDGDLIHAGELADQVMVLARDYIAGWIRARQAEGRYRSIDAEIVAEIEARLAVSLVLTPAGRIPMHDDDATRGFAQRYLMPLLGPEFS